MTEPGRLRTLVQLQAPLESEGDEGDIDREWETRGTAWVEIRGLSGREFWQAAQVNAQVDSRVTGRAVDLEEVTADWRLLTDKGRKMHIRAKLRDDRDPSRVTLLVGEVT